MRGVLTAYDHSEAGEGLMLKDAMLKLKGVGVTSEAVAYSTFMTELDSATEQLQAYQDMSLGAGEPEMVLLLETEHDAEVDLRISTKLSMDPSGAAAYLASFNSSASAPGNEESPAGSEAKKFFDDENQPQVESSSAPGSDSTSRGVACVLPFLLEEAEESGGQSLRLLQESVCGQSEYNVRWLLLGILPESADPAGYGGPSVCSSSLYRLALHSARVA
eukprot:SAG31_NODE_2770_length_5116_cov_3.834164_4_plen_219_part_00